MCLLCPWWRSSGFILMTDDFCVISLGKQRPGTHYIFYTVRYNIINYIHTTCNFPETQARTFFTSNVCSRDTVPLRHNRIQNNNWSSAYHLQRHVSNYICVCLIFFTAQMIITRKIMTIIRWKKNNIIIGEVPNMFLMMRKLPLAPRNFLNINYYFV